MRVFAFSLIELMVVITIIAILAAIAVPSYKSYMLGSRMTATARHVDRILHDAFVYYSKKGVFPIASDLGMGTGYYFNASVRPSNLSFMGMDSVCNKMGFIYGAYIPSTLGGGITVASFTCLFGDVNGVVQQQCFYNYSMGGAYTDSNYGDGVWLGMPASNSGTGSLIPGWKLENTTNNSDTNNFAPYYNAMYAAACP